jgi:hypothetical protein
MKRDLKNPLAPTTEPSFRTAFSENKKKGKKTFMWNNKNYNTQTAEEKAQYLKDSGNISKLNKEQDKATYNYYKAIGVESKPLGKDLQKSTKEIHDSYENVGNNGIEGGKMTRFGRKKK